jgi:transposase
MHQDLQTLLRCHMQAFEAIGGVPIEILYDRMKTAVTGEDSEGHIIYNRSLLALARHYGFQPKACRLLISAENWLLRTFAEVQALRCADQPRL